PIMTLQTLPVDANGTVLAYTDTGKPATDTYTTIFAIHGMNFNGLVFKRLGAAAAKQNIRLVAVNRRQYEGSTPYAGAEGFIPITGSDEEKAGFLASRGIELANFVSTFIEKNELPPISADGKTGGVAFLSWSAGSTLPCAAIANIGSLSADAQARFKSHLRAHVMYETPSLALGLPLPPDNWSPHIDKSIPEEKHALMFTSWISGYFDHGDLSTRDLKVLNYHVPSPYRRPSIYDMTKEEVDSMVDMRVVEIPAMFMSMAQANAAYKKALFDKEIKTLVPSLKTTYITGDATASYSIAALWSIEDDNKAEGGNVKTVVVPGVNHFFHWEDSEGALKVFLD
ncbi:hypothetical protein R3P38DRAFT_2846065, partial [Favolaschia claudopus]